MKFLLFITIIILTLSSCGTSESNDWYRYQFKLKALGTADNLVLLKLNDVDSTYLIHWFMEDSYEEKIIFCRMSFKGKQKFRSSDINLPANLYYDKYKVNDGRIKTFPLDSSTDFVFDTITHNLNAFNIQFTQLSGFSNSQTKKLMDEFENWDLNKINLLSYN